MNRDWARTVVSDPEMQVRIHGAKQNRCIAPNGVTDNRLRLPKAQFHQTNRVVCSGHWSFLRFQVENGGVS